MKDVGQWPLVNSQAGDASSNLPTPWIQNHDRARWRSAPRMHQKSAESEARDQQASSSRAPHASRRRDNVEDLHKVEHQRAPRSQRLKTLNFERPLLPFSDQCMCTAEIGVLTVLTHAVPHAILAGRRRGGRSCRCGPSARQSMRPIGGSRCRGCVHACRRCCRTCMC